MKGEEYSLRQVVTPIDPSQLGLINLETTTKEDTVRNSADLPE